MKIADLAAWILNHHSNSAENNPEIWSSYEVIEELKFVDKITEVLSEKYDDDDAAMDAGGNSSDSNYLTLSRDYSVAEIIEALDKVYTFGFSGLDSWLDEHDSLFSSKNNIV